MTDLETIKAMLKRAEVPFEEDRATEEPGVTVPRGYKGHFVMIEFFADGSLKNMGAWS